jgi:hypothetical protein
VHKFSQLGFDTVFHPVAGTFNDDRLGVMKKSIEDGGGNGAIALKDRGPLFEGLIGGNNDGTAFVSLADDLEKQVGTALIDRQIPYLVQNEQSRRDVTSTWFEAVVCCKVQVPRMKELLFAAGMAQYRGLGIVDVLCPATLCGRDLGHLPFLLGGAREPEHIIFRST